MIDPTEIVHAELPPWDRMIAFGLAESVKSPGAVTASASVELGCCDPLIPVMVIEYFPAVAFTVTKIDRVVVVDPSAGGVTVLLSSLTVTPEGTLPTVRFTGASKPPKDVTWTNELPDRPGARDSVPGVTSIVKVPENSMNMKSASLRSGSPNEYPRPPEYEVEHLFQFIPVEPKLSDSSNA